MSSGFIESEVVVVGALYQQLWIYSLLLTISSVFSACCMLLCLSEQRLTLVNPAVSMRLRPRRTCSGVVCFGGFHIQRFSTLFLFLRGDLT
ncbi:uncharacterized protein LOC107467466 [Arachis duranensis]|uniref:Transmembrane protein n=2 Tax=Arachis TaxID=3817 RepID=A0A445BEK4_ARAHY|nr:uncharacterized protein LOC107467466 [Arachis duranensis]XP_057733484.1 uncharacterized protein LOC130948662 [Arachis stenosperma]QHO36116.1 Transmembrane protein, putative [Arachis hypogaea]RYR37100.1 hypothetical protein Ahy_A09g042027 isoform A [Arachis hypogaea]